MRPGEVLADRFELLEVAGSGGMSTVFKARDLDSGEAVAVKVLLEHHAADAERLTREARVLAGLRHPGIVRLVADGLTPSGQPFLALEWLEGSSLAQRLEHTGLDAAASVGIATAVADALAAAHRVGIVHRDVKPGNVFLLGGTPDRVKVLDFGIARVASATVALTQTGTILGTPTYMAPEQARGDRELDPRADVFALGCVLFECLTGRPPFVGRHAAAVLARILLEDAPRASSLRGDVPGDLDELLDRMLAKLPEGRPPDGAAVAAALRSLAPLGEGPPSRPSGPRRALTTSERRLLSVVAAGGAPRRRDDAATQSAPAERPGEATLNLVRRSVQAHGGHLELLADGSLVAVLGQAAVATDQAARAARCALSLRALLPGRAIALATGRGTMKTRTPVGEVIDRAVRLVAEAPFGASGDLEPVWLDGVSAGLLETSFEIEATGAGHALRAEREQAAGVRTLLGKATPCVGRDRELATLEAIFAECVAEPVARAVLLSGPAGAGKSRVRAEHLARVAVQHPGTAVWIARGDVMRAGEPFAMIAQLVRRAVGVRAGDDDSTARTSLQAAAQVVPGEAERRRVAEFLGELLGLPFPDIDSPQLRAARGSAIVMGDQMLRAFVDFLDAACARQPVLLVLEDLQWGDLPSVKYVDTGLRNLREAPLGVLAVARPEVHELFPRLWAERGLEEIRLGELSRRASERLVREVLGESADDTLVASLVQRSGGNPFFLEELIRAAAEGSSAALPETVLAVLGARLEALPVAARRLLRAGSLLGQRMAADALAFLLGESDVGSVREWLGLLADSELLTPVHDDTAGEGAFAFRNALVRDAAYATLTDEDRALGHRLAAEWLEAHGPVEPGALGEHWQRGGESARAVPCFQKAAALSLQGNDFAQALERVARGEACGAGGETLGELTELAAEARHWRGEAAEAEALAERAMTLLPRGGPRFWAAATVLAVASGRLAHHDRLEALADELVALPAPRGHEGTAAAAAVAAAVALCHAGRLPVADRILERATAAFARHVAEPAVRAWLDRGHGLRAIYAGDTATALRLTETSARAFEDAGDLRMACQQWGNVGFVKRELGLFAEAEAALRTVLARAERMGLSHIVPTAQHNLGWALAVQGDIAGALDVERQAAAAFARQHDLRFEGTTHVYLARIQLLAGDLEAAAQEVATAVALLANTPQSRAWALGVHAEVLLARGDGGAAAAAGREAVALLREVGGTDEGEAVVYLAAARALAASGAVDEASGVLAEGMRRLSERAAGITDPAWRASLLEAIPEHRGMRALAASLGVA